jgi:hypothetical protein
VRRFKNREDPLEYRYRRKAVYNTARRFKNREDPFFFSFLFSVCKQQLEAASCSLLDDPPSRRDCRYGPSAARTARQHHLRGALGTHSAEKAADIWFKVVQAPVVHAKAFELMQALRCWRVFERRVDGPNGGDLSRAFCSTSC